MIRFERDPAFERQVLAEDFVRDTLEDLAARAAARASALAPDDPNTGSPDLHSSVFGDVNITAGGWKGRVGATDFKARWFEEGTARFSARPFLRPAVEEIVGPIEAAPEGEE